jgi:hypothetical protein
LESIYHRAMEKANEGDESNDFDYALDTEGDNYVDDG